MASFRPYEGKLGIVTGGSRGECPLAQFRRVAESPGAQLPAVRDRGKCDMPDDAMLTF